LQPTENSVTQADKLFPADPAKVAEAKDRVNTAIDRRLAVSHARLATVVASVTRHVYAQCFPTMQVQLAADRIPVLGIGPDFVCSIDNPDDVKFVVAHEAMHLIVRHLFVSDMQKRTDPMYTVCIEAWINYYLQCILHCDLPTIDGEPTGVDPKKFWDKCRKAAKDEGITGFPTTIEDFYRSDDTCFDWARQIKKNFRDSQNFCVQHMQDDGEGGEGGSGGDPSEDEGEGSPMTGVMDPDALGDLVEKALKVTLQEAIKEGNKAAKADLERLMDATVGNEKAEQIFGQMGAYELLGKTSPAKRTNFWDRLVNRSLTSLIKPGNRLTYNRKRPRERMFAARGKRLERQILIAIDTSGSMFYGDALEKVREMVGATKAKSRWVWFDGEVWEFNPGDDMHGGGGTNCSLVEDWILKEYRRYPDAVICVTDGYFEHFTPSQPKRWIWLITREGDNWPDTWEPRMKSQVLPFG